MTNTSLSTLISPSSLRRISGNRFFERGKRYFEEERIEHLTGEAELVSAIVEGSEDYRGNLWCKNGELAFSCSCPLCNKGFFSGKTRANWRGRRPKPLSVPTISGYN